jgi:lysine-N-methylase
VEGDLGQDLRRNIYQDDDGAHFLLTEDERCPFLRDDGLCRLICELGKDALCEICALHPRFFTDFGEHTICGLGLSCEAACDLLLNSDAPLCVISEAGERMTVPALLGLSGDALRFDGALPSVAYLRRMGETEPIDDRWPEELSKLFRGVQALQSLPTGARYDRMLQYLLLRQLDRMEDTPLERLIGYARDSTAFIAAQDALFGTDAEHLRRWSEQIEYSTENVDILLG